jgi:hypothetical protein
MNRTSLGFAALLIILVAISGCSKKGEETSKQAQPQSSSATVPGSVAGIHWSVPSRWISQPERPMRAATYTVPSPSKDLDAGECAVFFFGSGQGGNINDNLNRWISQFDKGGSHELKDREVNGMQIKLIEITGTYLAPSGPMMESQGKKEGYKLLGAIISAPEGSVFFKFTGPAKSVDASAGEFDRLVSTIAKN